MARFVPPLSPAEEAVLAAAGDADPVARHWRRVHLQSNAGEVDLWCAGPSNGPLSPPRTDVIGRVTCEECLAAEKTGEPRVRIDHRALLVKYIQFVNDALASNADPYPLEHQFPPTGFTDTEWAELQRLAGKAPRG